MRLESKANLKNVVIFESENKRGFADCLASVHSGGRIKSEFDKVTFCFLRYLWHFYQDLQNEFLNYYQINY